MHLSSNLLNTDMTRTVSGRVKPSLVMYRTAKLVLVACLFLFISIPYCLGF